MGKAETRQIPDRLLCPRSGLDEVAHEQMRSRQPKLHPVAFWIQRAQLHRMSKLPDRLFGFAVPQANECAEEPRGGKIVIQLQRPIQKRNAFSQVVTGKMSE